MTLLLIKTVGPDMPPRYPVGGPDDFSDSLPDASARWPEDFRPVPDQHDY